MHKKNLVMDIFRYMYVYTDFPNRNEPRFNILFVCDLIFALPSNVNCRKINVQNNVVNKIT